MTGGDTVMTGRGTVMTEGGAVMTGKLTALFPEIPINLLKNSFIFYDYLTCITRVLGELRNYTRAVQCRIVPIAIRHDGPSGSDA